MTVVRSDELPVVRPAGSVPEDAVVRGRVKTQPGEVRRFFWRVPAGATWADLVLRGYHADRPRLYFVDIVQLQPHATHKDGAFKRPVTVTLEAQTSSFALVAGATLELCIAHYWNSLGAGDLEFELRCHGLAPRSRTLELHGTEGCLRVDVEALSREDDVQPSASLTVLRQALRPTESVCRPLPPDPRDALWNGRHIWERVLTYTFKIADGQGDLTLVRWVRRR